MKSGDDYDLFDMVVDMFTITMAGIFILIEIGVEVIWAVVSGAFAVVWSLLGDDL